MDDSRFPDRRDAHQLFDARCTQDQLDALLTTLERCHARTTYPWRKIVLHDAPTVRHLVPRLARRGWSCARSHMMPLESEARRAPNPDVEVRSVPFDDPDGHRAAIAMDAGTNLEALRYWQARDERLGGEVLVGYLEGEPVGRTGWYIVDGVARFRPVRTVRAARGRGVATTLIRHVQDHPAVRAAQALVIFCDEDGPVPLYEQLGFRKRHGIWECLRKLPDFVD